MSDYDPFELSKRKVEKETGSSGTPSVGRTVAGTLFAPVHGAVAGRKGKKIEAAGSEAIGTMAGGVAGRLVGAGVGAAVKRPMEGAALGGLAGAVGGGGLGVRHANKSGYYKVQKGFDMPVSAFGVEHPGLEDIEKASPFGVAAARLGRGISEAASNFKAKQFTGGLKAFGGQAKKAGQMTGVGVKRVAGQARTGLGNMSFGGKLATAGAATVAAGAGGAYLGRKSFGKSAFGVDEYSDELSKAESPRQLMTLQRIAGMKVSSVPKGAKNSSKVADAFKDKNRATRSAKLAAGQSVSS